MVVVGIIVVVIIALTIFVSTFDVNKYKPQVEQKISSAVGYNLKIDGDLGLKIFPAISVQVKGLHLENPEVFRAQAADLAYVEKANVGLALRPLLSKRFEFNDIVLTGVNLNLITPEKGEPNWNLNAYKAKAADDADLPESVKNEAKNGDSAAKIAGLLNSLSFNQIAVKNTKVVINNLAAKSLQTFDNIDFICGPFNNAQKPLNFSLSAKMNNTPLSVKGELTSVASLLDGAVPFNVDVTFDKLAAKVQGQYAAISDPMLNATVTVPAFNPKDVMKSLMKTVPDIIAKSGSGAFAKLETTQTVKMAKNGVISFTGPYTFDQTSGNISGTFNKGAMTAKVSANQLRPATYVSGQPMLEKLSVSGLNADVKFSGGVIDAAFDTKYAMDQTNGSVAGTFNNKGNLQNVTVNLSGDTINLDSLLGQSASKGGASSGSSSGNKAKKPLLDAGTFGKLNIAAKVKLSQAIFKGLTFNDINADVKLNQGVANATFSANSAGGGSANGSFAGNLTAQNAQKTLTAKTTNLQLQPLLKALMNKDLIAAPLNADVNVSGGGMDIDDMKRSLSGNVNATINKGQILAGPGLSFNSIITNLAFTNGNGQITKGNIDSNLLAADITGNINMANDSLDITVQPTKAMPADAASSVANLFLPSGQTLGLTANVPFRIYGPFSNIKFDAKPTVQNLLENLNLQELKNLDVDNLKDNLKENLKGNLEQGLKDKLEETAPGAGSALDGLFNPNKNKSKTSTATESGSSATSTATEQPATQQQTTTPAVQPATTTTEQPVDQQQSNAAQQKTDKQKLEDDLKEGLKNLFNK